MQTPPIIFIICMSVGVLLLFLSRNKRKAKNTALGNLPEPYATLMLVVAWCSLSIIMADLIQEEYFSRPVLDIARLVNIFFMAFSAYSVFRQNHKES